MAARSSSWRGVIGTGFFYILNREHGQFVSGDPFVTINWAESLDDNGRPIETPQAPGEPTFPGVQGGTNWYSPSYSPSTKLFYLSAWEGYSKVFEAKESEYVPGRLFLGGRFRNPNPAAPEGGGITRGPINDWTEETGTGAVIALDPATGDERWRYDMTDVTSSGILTTGTDLLFTGNREGHFHALDAQTGDLLWRRALGGMISNGPMSFAVDGQQFVRGRGSNGLFVFGSPERTLTKYLGGIQNADLRIRVPRMRAPVRANRAAKEHRRSGVS